MKSNKGGEVGRGLKERGAYLRRGLVENLRYREIGLKWILVVFKYSKNCGKRDL